MAEDSFDRKLIQETFSSTGRVWLRNMLDKQEIERFAKLMHSSDQMNERMDRTHPLFQAILESSFLTNLRIVWPNMKPVRLVSFDKSAGSNWALPWHQDRVIAVEQKHELEGFTNWSFKGRVWHCEPPKEILDQMLFVRVHLDACSEENGAMEIAPVSHHEGVLTAQEAIKTASKYDTEFTKASQGDVLVLKMLTLHRSGKSYSAQSRSVLRIDLASDELPHPLEWAI